jgi:low affinity Fe/Cu permease
MVTPGLSGSRVRCGSTGRASGRRERRVRGGDVAGTEQERRQGVDGVFSAFASSVAKWTGSHWAFVVAAVLMIVSLLTTDVEETNLAISIVTLLMVLVLQNTQNRDSAALHLKLDEVVRAEPEARDEIRGAESRSAREIGELMREDSDSLARSSDGRPGE